jgi:hypothetical protein
LADEVRRLGVDPEWLRTVQAEPRGVYFSEHLTFLPTLFAKLGHFGGPAALQRALLLQAQLRRRLALQTGAPTGWGIFTSLDFAVANHGVTSGFYVSLGDGTGGQVSRQRFLSCEELKSFTHRGFRDVWICGKRLQTVLGSLDRAIGTAKPLARQRPAYSRRLKALEALRSAFVLTLRATLGDEERVGLTSIHYAPFIAELNRRFVMSLGFRDDFAVTESTAANLLPTHGVFDWARLLSIFLKKGLQDEGEPVLRLRGPTRAFRNLKLQHIGPSGITLVDSRDGEVFRLEALVEESRAAVHQGLPPTLLPGAPLRYWATRALGLALLLDNGMRYEKLERLSRALQDP